jgi:phospholipid transport system transporter-binding protein
VQLPAIATLAEADTLLSALKSAVPAAGDSLRIDASGLQHFDTSLVALLLHARRAVQAAGGTMTITDAPPKLADLARLYGVESLLPLA